MYTEYVYTHTDTLNIIGLIYIFIHIHTCMYTHMHVYTCENTYIRVIHRYGRIEHGRHSLDLSCPPILNESKVQL